MAETFTPSTAETIQYDVRDVTSIIVNSFRFSRGSGNLQDSLLTFIGARRRDHFKDMSVLEASKPDLETAVHAIYTNPKLHPAPNPNDPRKFGHEDTVKAVSVEVNRYLSRLKGGVKFGPLGRTDTQNLCGQLIDTENTWIGRNSNWVRPPKRLPIRPFSSNLITHGFLEKSTGRDEFDEIFQFIGDLVLREPEEKWCPPWRQGNRQVSRLISGHVKYNPDDNERLAGVLADTPFENVLD